MEGGEKPLHRTRARPTVQRRSLTLTRESVRAKEPRMVRFPRVNVSARMTAARKGPRRERDSQCLCNLGLLGRRKSFGATRRRRPTR
jgi:hypothetical protein